MLDIRRIGAQKPRPIAQTTFINTSLQHHHAYSDEGNPGSTGLPTSSVLLYEPFGQATASSTFGTNSNPTNSSNESMGWAAGPTRKVESLFTVPVIQMGARIYLPTAGRFLQVDPVEGGTLNSYTYVNDPVNGNDYSGLCAYVIQCTATVNRLQPAAPISRVQPTAPGTRVQSTSTRPLQARAQTATQVSAPKRTLTQLSIPQLKRIDMSTIPMSPTARAGDPKDRVREPSIWRDAVAPRLDHALNAGRSSAEVGQYAGYAVGCMAGSAAAVYGSAVSFGGTILLAGVACAAGAETGGGAGYIISGGIGFVVGLFTY